MAQSALTSLSISVVLRIFSFLGRYKLPKQFINNTTSTSKAQQHKTKHNEFLNIINFVHVENSTWRRVYEIHLFFNENKEKRGLKILSFFDLPDSFFEEIYNKPISHMRKSKRSLIEEDTESGLQFRTDEYYESDSDDEQTSFKKIDVTTEYDRRPLISLEILNTFRFYMWKPLLHYFKSEEAFTNLINGYNLVLLCHGGDFAASIFDKREPLEGYHKTFSRYIVRKKQGKRQSSHEQNTHRSQSAGSHLRRFNEKKFGEEVTELLEQWKHFIIEKVNNVFIYCPGMNNKRLVFYENGPLGNYTKDLFEDIEESDEDDDDPNYNSHFNQYYADLNRNKPKFTKKYKFFSIPFPTQTPNFSQTKLAYDRLFSVGVEKLLDDKTSQKDYVERKFEEFNRETAFEE